MASPKRLFDYAQIYYDLLRESGFFYCEPLYYEFFISIPPYSKPALAKTNSGKVIKLIITDNMGGVQYLAADKEGQVETEAKMVFIPAALS